MLFAFSLRMSLAFVSEKLIQYIENPDLENANKFNYFIASILLSFSVVFVFHWACNMPTLL